MPERARHFLRLLLAIVNRTQPPSYSTHAFDPFVCRSSRTIRPGPSVARYPSDGSRCNADRLIDTDSVSSHAANVRITFRAEEVSSFHRSAPEM